ncbi:MAG: hypothetical protein K1X79_08850 [Oligoflexia bacterium]|nr:hypothetical protein [Oligoflexia bacterium]
MLSINRILILLTIVGFSALSTQAAHAQSCTIATVLKLSDSNGTPFEFTTPDFGTGLGLEPFTRPGSVIIKGTSCIASELVYNPASGIWNVLVGNSLLLGLHNVIKADCPNGTRYLFAKGWSTTATPAYFYLPPGLAQSNPSNWKQLN